MTLRLKLSTSSARGRDGFKELHRRGEKTAEGNAEKVDHLPDSSRARRSESSSGVSSSSIPAGMMETWLGSCRSISEVGMEMDLSAVS